MRTLILVYGVACYLLTGAVALYFAGFVFGLDVPRLAQGPGAPTPANFGVDLALIALFGAQHSVMARPAFKRLWTRLICAPVERSTYVLASDLALAALVACWQPLGLVGNPPWPRAWVWLMWGVTGLGALILIMASFQIDHADLLGLGRVWDHYRGREAVEPAFQVRGLYRYVRHPLMTGLLIVLWAPPVASLDRLLLSVGITAYVLLALRWEERDLSQRFGAVYENYRRAAPSLIPWRGRVCMIAIGEHADGLVLPVRAQPGARKPGAKGEQNGALKLAVTAPPEDGRANDALVELLRELLGLRRSQVELIAGQTSRHKKFLIRGLTREELAARVAAIVQACG